MTKLDWPGLMRAGICVLGLTPGDFWRLSPAELQLLLGPSEDRLPMNRTRLDDLMTVYPD